MTLTSEKFRRLLGKLKHLDSLLDAGAGISLPQADDLSPLVGERGAPRLFLGVYTRDMVLEGLERHGVMQKLRSMDLDDLEIRFDTFEADRHTLRILCRNIQPRCLLAEATFHVGDFETKAAFAPDLHGHHLRMIYALWLRMQNPKGEFRADRPVMPGQEKPGLRVAHQVDLVFRAMAERLQCHGIINRPEFFHAAVIYSPSYRFFDPRMEGMLLALKRDLSHLHLADASWAVYSGCVWQESPGPPQEYRWEPEEQILGLEEPLAGYFESEKYRSDTEAASDQFRFRLDEEAFRVRTFYNPDGSPTTTEESQT